jgi:hypothetical protein
VQVAGVSFFWDQFIRLSHEAAVRWLGTPESLGRAHAGARRSLRRLPRGHVPPAVAAALPAGARSPLALAPRPLHHDWKTAEADAPWKRYTTIELDLSATYSQVRVDWWYLGLREVAPGVSLALLLLFAAGPRAAWCWWGETCAGRPRREVSDRSAPRAEC